MARPRSRLAWRSAFASRLSHPAEVFQRLAVFKPEFIGGAGMAALWGAYVVATLALVAGGVVLARGIKREE